MRDIHPKTTGRLGGFGGWAREGGLGGWALVAGLLVLAVVPALTPWVGQAAREAIMSGFSFVCHQLPGRSPHVHGTQWAICHRDVGLYWGLPFGAALFVVFHWVPAWMYRSVPLVFAAALVPMGFDWGLDVVGLLDNTPVSRGITGLVFGLTAGYILAYALDSSSKPD